MNKLSVDQVLERVKYKYGSNISFKNIDSQYSCGSTMITATCSIHGDFRCNANNLLRSRHGCPVCANLIGIALRTSPLEHVSGTINRKYGNRYTFPYLKSEYKNNKSLLTGICETHGKFLIRFDNIISQDYICRGCLYERVADALRLSLTEVIDKLDSVNHIRGTQYAFPHLKSEYVDTHSELTVVCPIHGEFHSTFKNFTRTKGGCPKCGIFRGCVSRRNVPAQSGLSDYKRYHMQVLTTDRPTEGPDGELQVECHLCGSIMTPTRNQVYRRITAVNEINNGESNFYCSDKCKSECTTYNKSSRWTPKNMSLTEYEARVAKARGCQGKDKYALRQLQFDEHGYYFCEKCGKMVNNQELHHTIEVAKDPEGAITVAGHMLVCVKCHKEFTKECR